MKKIIASVSLVAILATNTVFADVIWTITWGNPASTDINSTWTGGTNDPDGSTASWSTDVIVSATVVPTLTMTLSTGALNYGVLQPNTPQTKTVDVTTATNAEGWITVSVASNGLQSATKVIGDFGTLWAGAKTADADDYYKIASSIVSWGTWATVHTLDDVASSQPVLTAGDVVAANATTQVSLSAMAGNMTEAGSYSDTLTFTVTGTF